MAVAMVDQTQCIDSPGTCNIASLFQLSVQNKNRTAVLDAQFPHMQQPVKPVSHKSKPDDQWTSAEKLSDLVVLT